VVTTEPESRSIRFNILGPLEGWANEHRLKFGGPIQERVLTVLLLETNRVVPVSRLIEAVWGEEPPATALQQIRKAVAELRRRIPQGLEVIATEGSGYRTVLEPGQLDMRLFQRKTAQATAEAANGRLSQAAEQLTEAMALWRGHVLCGTGGTVIDSLSATLEEHRLAATEQLFELRLALGQDSGLVGAIRETVGAHPLRERLRGQLMLALYRTGRQAEALAEYAKVRTLLVDELGIDPSPELSRLYEKILRADPELAVPEGPAAGGPAAPSEPEQRAVEAALPVPALRTPCTLPYDLVDFTGREREMNWLLDLAADGRGAGLVGIDGMGGCGKSTLAVHAAHALAGAYPDGQLHVDLRGSTPGERPLRPDAVAALLLKALGSPDAQIPDDVESCLPLWQSWAANRRLLLILDNAADTAQIRPLVAAMPYGFVLVTSRARLVDLDGAQWISLSSMEPTESVTLLTRTLGEERVATEPKAAAALAELCGHLPLALRIATARLRNRPLWTLQYLAGRLRDESRRLKELSSGERSVATTVQLSYQALRPDAQAAFLLLGLHPGAGIDKYAAAALTATTPAEAEEILEDLLDVHLLHQPAIGLYSFHDLVRSFARSLWEPGPQTQSTGALGRLLAFYVAATEEACRVLFPGWRRYDVASHGPPAELPPLGTEPEALSWFEREQRALQAAVALGHEHGWYELAAYLARNMVFHLHHRGDIRGFQEVSEIGVAAARQSEDPWTLRLNLMNLATAQSMLGNFRQAAAAAEEGLRIVTSQGDRFGEGAYLDQLGWVHGSLGNLAQGQTYLQRAVEVHRETGNAMQESFALCNLSSIHTHLGRPEEAVAAAQRAVLLCRRMGARQHQAAALNDLAIAYLDGGDHEAGLTVLDQALSLGEAHAMPRNLALTMALMANACQLNGRGDQALGYLEQALTLVRPLSVKGWQSQIENLAGLVRQRRGEYPEAHALHEEAFRNASAIEYRIEMAWALAGMAQSLDELGDHPAASEYRGRADEHFDAMNVPAGRRRRA